MQTCYLQLLPQYLVRPAARRNLRPVVNTPNFSSNKTRGSAGPVVNTPNFSSNKTLLLSVVIGPGVADSASGSPTGRPRWVKSGGGTVVVHVPCRVMTCGTT